MGLVRTSLIFDGRAPDAACVAEGITAITGLAVTVADSSVAVRDDFRQLNAKLAFTCVPQEEITIYAYVPGAVWKRQAELQDSLKYESPIRFHGLDEPQGTQSVYVEGYVMQEGTLLTVATLALEALGGRPEEPIPDEERRFCGRPISETELLERHRRMRRKRRVMIPIAVACGLVATPFFIVSTLVRLPFVVWRECRAKRRTRL